MKQCHYCKQEVIPQVNYCSFDCQIKEAKSLGGKVITPNNLPIACIKADGTMMEDPHADHPDYKFPIKIEYFGNVPEDLPEWDCSYQPETHALIYTDGFVALTLYEYRYSMWYAKGGGAADKDRYKDWRLTEESINKIKEWNDDIKAAASISAKANSRLRLLQKPFEDAMRVAKDLLNKK